MQQLNLEEQLERDGIVSPAQMQTIRLEQQRSSVSLVQALRQLKVISEEKLTGFLGKHLNLEEFRLNTFSPDKALLALVPAELLWEKKVIPLFKDNFELAVGVLDPLDSSIYDELRFRTGLFIKPYLVREDELIDVLSRCCDRREGQRHERQESAHPALKIDDGYLKEEFSKPSIIEAVNLLLLQALKFGASDIHIEAQRDKMRLRLRIDGVLKEITPPESTAYNAFVSRIKIMANLDIAERRQPQDGRFNVELDGTALDVRVSVIPTIERESIVLRLLKQNKKVLTLNQLGMSQKHLERYEQLIRKPSGIILVTGPTGSGKTTTLYASLSIIQSVEKNIITIEDPVEYHLDFCRQIQVNQKVNLTFANGLRSILRHDPDIIMVGEIRDLETATIAIQAALTGHLVFSTLHTNDAASAVTRLVDMGIEPFLIASCLNGVVAQRLVRVLCKKCKSKQSKKLFKEAPYADKEVEVWEAHGCQDCLHTGFSGRVGIFEIMEMTPQIGRLTVEKASSTEIIKACRAQGMTFMYDDGWEKIVFGATNVAEVLRVLGPG
jgi:type II secretory ATPase GspE/PulE/Tfp pilus assembly ATPase PilB-like protein